MKLPSSLGFVVLVAVTLAVTANAETPAERTRRFLTDFDPGGGIALQRMIDSPDRALARRLLFAIDPYFAETWRLSRDDPSRLGPDLIAMARFRIAPKERERLFIMVTTPGACTFRACPANVFVRKGRRWVRDFTVWGAGSEGEGWISILAEPIVGRFFDLKTEKHAEPTIIEPNNNGRPVFIWRYEGVVWDGRDWAPFCWRGTCR
jgi:hypothetical protein